MGDSLSMLDTYLDLALIASVPKSRIPQPVNCFVTEQQCPTNHRHFSLSCSRTWIGRGKYDRENSIPWQSCHLFIFLDCDDDFSPIINSGFCQTCLNNLERTPTLFKLQPVVCILPCTSLGHFLFLTEQQYPYTHKKNRSFLIQKNSRLLPESISLALPKRNTQAPRCPGLPVEPQTHTTTYIIVPTAGVPLDLIKALFDILSWSRSYLSSLSL